MSLNGTCTCDDENNIEPLWSGAHCHIVITGASRGFGRSLCVQLIKSLTAVPGEAASVTMLLLARDLLALQQTKYQALLSKVSGSPTHVDILTPDLALDMVHATESTLRSTLQPLFDHTTTGDGRQWNLLIHNAATLGNLELRADQRTSDMDLDAYYHVNLIAPMVLTSVFLAHFAPFGSIHPPVTVVNVSSLAAVQPLAHMSEYCVGKAAREMYMQALAVDRPTVAVFNYSPGPLDTDMYTELVERHGDPKLKATAAEQKRMGALIAPDESARVCVSWLRRRHSACPLNDDGEEIPKALVCPVHQGDYIDIWRGSRLDYYDAVTLVKRPPQYG